MYLKFNLTIHFYQAAFCKIRRHLGADLPYDEEIILIEDAPQQECGSVDCGVVVLYIIKQFFTNEPVLKKVAERDMKKHASQYGCHFLHWGRDAEHEMNKRFMCDDGEGPSA